MALAVPTTVSTQRRALTRRLAALCARRGALVLLFAAALCTLRMHAAVDRYDEGVILQGAWRVAHGQVPYRDFFTVYAPGQFYAVAALFRLFGPSVLAERLVDAAGRVLLAAAVYGWLVRLADRRLALATALVAAAAIAFTGNAGYPIFTPLATALTCGLCLDRARRAVSWRWFVAAGACAGLTALFRLDFAVYLLPAALVVAALGQLSLWPLCYEGRGTKTNPGELKRWLDSATAVASLRQPTTDRLRSSARLGGRPGGGLLRLATCAASFALIVLPAVLLLLRSAPLAVVRYDLLTYPTTTLQSVYGLPHPSPLADLGALLRLQPPLTPHDQFFRLLFYGPIALLTLEALSLARAARRAGRAALNADRLARLFLLLVGAALVRQEVGRFDETHALPVGLCTLPLLARWLAAWCPWRRGARLHVLGTLLLAWAALLYLVLPLADVTAALATTPPWRCQSFVAAASCAQLDADQQQAAAYLLAHTAPNEPVFVANAQNQDGVVSDVALNMLADRPSPTLYMQYEPAISNTAAVQQREIAEIERANVRVVVLVDTVAPHEPNGSSVPSGVTLLDDYLRAHYHTVFTAGSYSVAERD